MDTVDSLASKIASWNKESDFNFILLFDSWHLSCPILPLSLPPISEQDSEKALGLHPLVPAEKFKLSKLLSRGNPDQGPTSSL